MPERPIVMCLGAGTHQLELIAAILARGFDCLAVDRNPAAVGFSEAVTPLHSDLTDVRGILRRLAPAIRQRLIGVTSRSFGAVRQAQQELTTRLELPGMTAAPDQAPNWALLTDKRAYKQFFGDLGIPVPRQFNWSDPPARQQLLDWPSPLLARPVAGHAKQDMHILNDKDQRRRFLEAHQAHAKDWLVEELLAARRELTVLAWVVQGEVILISISAKITSASPPRFIELGHDFPLPVSLAVARHIESLLQRMAQAAGLDNTPLVAEFLYDDPPAEDSLWLVEWAAESGGELLVDQLLAALDPGYHYFDRLLDLHLLPAWRRYRPSDFRRTPWTDSQRAACVRYVAPQAGLYQGIQWPPELLADRRLLYRTEFHAVGQQLDFKDGNRARPAAFVVADERSRARELFHWADRMQAASRLILLDPH
ncbi:MAG: hypothetical protein KDK39_01535 [Leptospiraceae bacterium]|nr:hypothetical protein [Leptospiraceae bacterium]